MNIEQTIRDYLPGVLHMSLATCADNKPWVCEVHFVYDDKLNLYFRSKVSRRHSQEIAANPSVAGDIVEVHGLNEKPRGIYFEGRAECMAQPSAEIFQLFKERFGLDDDIIPDAAEPDGHKIYKVAISDYYVFDARESKPSQKHHLKWSQKGTAS